jgi:cyclophilin family peptidyl-prolyl cis-trans isomerase
MSSSALGWTLALTLAAGAPAQQPPASPSTPAEPEAQPTPAAEPEPAADAAPVPAPGPRLVLETSEGTIVIRLRPDLAPNHVKHVVRTARAGRYDGTAFHRVIKNAIVQGGDPLSRDPRRISMHGTGGLGLLKAEFSAEPFERGSVGAALLPGNPNSGGSQFFICLFPQASLTGQYTLLGSVEEGLEVADRIGNAPVDGERPKNRIEIRKATVRE